MSGKVSGWVWDTNLPQNEKYVLLAYADHADHDGNNIFPSVDLVSRKTGYSHRSIQRIVTLLREKGYLVPVGEGPSGVNKYRIPMRGDKMTPPTGGGDTAMSGVTQLCQGRGDTAMTPGGDTAMTPEPSLTVKETSAFNNRETEKPESETDTNKSGETSQDGDETQQWLAELEENKPPQLERKPDGARLALEKYSQKQDGNAEIENYIVKLPERVRPIAREFCEYFGRTPIRKENSYWRTEWESQADLGLLPKHIKLAISDMESNGLHIKSPASVTSIAERYKREGAISKDPTGVTQVWKGGKRIR